MFQPSRDDARRFLFDTWKKQQSGQPLTDLERLAAAIMLDHPEYHVHLRQPERYLEQDWHPEQGQTNPFLHLMMHLSIDEQCSIDQPPGVRALLAALAERHGSRHTAQHEAMDGMAEMLWRAQREGRFPDPNVYLNILRDKLGEAEQFNLQRLDEIQ